MPADTIIVVDIHNARCIVRPIGKPMERDVKTQRKGTNEAIAVRIADHKRRMDDYMAQGLTREVASRKALKDMEGDEQRCAG